jgi:hypothetical protein
MANRFRSDLTRVPPVRIGVTKGGLTTTIGWDGPGVSASLLGGQAARPGGLAVVGDARFSGPLPTDRYLIPGTRTDFGTGDVARMTSPGLENFKSLLVAASARKRDIVADLAKARSQLFWASALRALGWATMACALPSLRKSAQGAIDSRRREIATLGANLDATAVSVDFDMDSEIGPPQRRMQEAFGRVVASRAKWTLRSSELIDRVRARSIAGTVVDRRPAEMGHGADALVATKEPPLALGVQGGRATAYFYPGFVLVAQRDGSDFALVDMVDLDVKWGETRFTETEGVPADAEVVGKAWAKSNKDGSRDRRFADNREIPVARYGALEMTAAGGLHESFMVSRVEPCEAFAHAVRDLKRVLASARTPGKVAGRRAISEGR